MYVWHICTQKKKKQKWDKNFWQHYKPTGLEVAAVATTQTVIKII